MFWSNVFGKTAWPQLESLSAVHSWQKLHPSGYVCIIVFKESMLCNDVLEKVISFRDILVDLFLKNNVLEVLLSQKTTNVTLHYRGNIILNLPQSTH